MAQEAIFECFEAGKRACCFLDVAAAGRFSEVTWGLGIVASLGVLGYVGCLGFIGALRGVRRRHWRRCVSRDLSRREQCCKRQVLETLTYRLILTAGLANKQGSNLYENWSLSTYCRAHEEDLYGKSAVKSDN